MEIDEETVYDDRFETDPPTPPVDVTKIIKILLEIKALKEWVIFFKFWNFC